MMMGCLVSEIRSNEFEAARRCMQLYYLVLLFCGCCSISALILLGFYVVLCQYYVKQDEMRHCIIGSITCILGLRKDHKIWKERFQIKLVSPIMAQQFVRNKSKVDVQISEIQNVFCPGVS